MILSGDIKINILGDLLFEYYLGVDQNIRGAQIGDNIYLRRSSVDILSDAVHEGVHAKDYYRTKNQKEISSWAGEIRAYSAEREFQIKAGLPVTFKNIDDMMVHIWREYPR